jgi:hypothetical protein
MEKGSVRASLMFLLVAFLVLFAAASLIAYTSRDDGKVTANTIYIDNKNTIRVPDSSQPLPNEDEGTIVLWTKPPVEIFDQFSDARDYIIFFSSTNVPGVRVVYNIRESRFEAGSPLLSSQKIDIFDGQNHQFVYTFKKGVEQAIYIDGVRVNSSGFSPMEVSGVTGFAIAVASIAEADIAGAEVAMYDHYISEYDLNDLNQA